MEYIRNVQQPDPVAGCINDELVNKHGRMLTGGFYAEIDVTYDSMIAEEKGHAFGIESLREIQLSKRDVLESF